MNRASVHTMFKSSFFQFVFLLVVVFFFAFLGHGKQAFSVFWGGFTYWLPNTLLVCFVFRGSVVRFAGAVLARFYVGEIIKWLGTFGMFFIGFSYFVLSPTTLLFSYIAMLLFGSFFSLSVCSKRSRINEVGIEL